MLAPFEPLKTGQFLCVDCNNDYGDIYVNFKFVTSFKYKHQD